MTKEKEAQCELQPEQARELLNGATLSESEKLASLKLLKDLEEGLIFSTGYTSKCFSEKEFLDARFMNGASQEDLARLDAILNKEKDWAVDIGSPGRPGTVKVIVYDGPRALSGHLREVSGILKSIDPRLTDKNILLGSSAAPDERVKGSMPVTGLELSGRADYRMLLEGNVETALQAVKHLESFVDIARNNPGLRVNISAELMSLYLKHPELKDFKAIDPVSQIDLGPALEGKLPSLAGSKVDNDSGAGFNKESIARIKAAMEKLRSSDVRVDTCLRVVEALKKLADAGAQVTIALGNEDRIDLALLLAQASSRNISAVAALDSKGEVASFNAKTAVLAREKAPGSAIAAPHSLLQQLEPGQFGNAVFLRDGSEHDDSVVGRPLDKVALSDSEIPQLKSMLEIWRRHGATDRFQVKFNDGELSRVQVEASMGKEYDRLFSVFGKDFSQHYKDREDFVKKMTDYKMDKSTDPSVQLLPPAVGLGLRASLLLDRAILRGLTKSDEYIAENSFDQFLNKLESDIIARLKDKVLTGEQVEMLYGQGAKHFMVSSDPIGKFYYRITHPELTRLSALSEYVEAETRDGAKVLVQHLAGTSLASPYWAAASSK